MFSSEKQYTTDQDVCSSLNVPERAILIYFTGRTDIDADQEIKSIWVRKSPNSPAGGTEQQSDFRSHNKIYIKRATESLQSERDIYVALQKQN